MIAEKHFPLQAMRGKMSLALAYNDDVIREAMRGLPGGLIRTVQEFCDNDLPPILQAKWEEALDETGVEDATGRLRRSLHVHTTVTHSRVQVHIAIRAPYAMYLNRGYATMSGPPPFHRIRAWLHAKGMGRGKVTDRAAHAIRWAMFKRTPAMTGRHFVELFLTKIGVPGVALPPMLGKGPLNLPVIGLQSSWLLAQPVTAMSGRQMTLQQMMAAVVQGHMAHVRGLAKRKVPRAKSLVTSDLRSMLYQWGSVLGDIESYGLSFGGLRSGVYSAARYLGDWRALKTGGLSGLYDRYKRRQVGRIAGTLSAKRFLVLPRSEDPIVRRRWSKTVGRHLGPVLRRLELHR